MKYRKLANTGTGLSNLALGAMDFGSKTTEAEAFAIIDRFWFAKRPADVTGRVVLASKARFGTGPDDSSKQTIAELEETT